MTALLLRDTKSPCRAQETGPSPTGKTHYPGATPPLHRPSEVYPFPSLLECQSGCPRRHV